MQSSDSRNFHQALDVGRTLTRFNFPQAEAFNPLGVLLAHHLAQHDESEPTTAEGTENNNPGADEPRPGVIDAILAPPVTLIAGEALQPEPADNVEQGSGSGDAGDGTVVRNSRPTEPTPPPGDVPIHSTRAGFAPGDLVFLTESFLDEGPTGTPEDQSPTINTVVGDQAEVVTSTQLNRSPEGRIITPITCPGRLTYGCFERQSIHHCKLECHNSRVPKGTWSYLKNGPW